MHIPEQLPHPPFERLSGLAVDNKSGASLPGRPAFVTVFGLLLLSLGLKFLLESFKRSSLRNVQRLSCIRSEILDLCLVNIEILR